MNVFIAEKSYRNAATLLSFVHLSCSAFTSFTIEAEKARVRPAIADYVPLIAFLSFDLLQKDTFPIMQEMLERYNTSCIVMSKDRAISVDSITNGACDFLQYPFSLWDIQCAIVRAKNSRMVKMKLQQQEEHIDFLSNLENTLTEELMKERMKLLQYSQQDSLSQQDSKYILIKDGAKIKKVLKDEIMFIQAMGSCSRIYLVSGESFTTTKLLTEYENELRSNNFLRVHRSYLINVLLVTQYRSDTSGNTGGSIVFAEEIIPVSRSKKQEFIWNWQYNHQL